MINDPPATFCFLPKLSTSHWQTFLSPPDRSNDNKNPADLCVLILRDSPNGVQAFGPLVACSNRQIKSFVGCNTMLEPGEYVVLPLTFNIWTLCQ